ncbi:hypothetical protein [Streptomyces hydrogenans]|uniref:Uncharacterized protein n=1 Tax=Streptomyces hydrogenans TaxID=1873719 RepID=A0ABQ3PJJ2_9ACTN|nr:hypothetical protein [Streptomyces hydrogenans]GHG10108.1 hypothetical protein GCM10018784_23490 [Streptomyces hydrogenans]GHI25199.1 hypothetical protein Shyd_65700 [Streptomyces hydrogenans]
MNRRMQANPQLPGNSSHRPEHDENYYCALGAVKCIPVPAEPGILVPATGTVLVVDGVVQELHNDESRELTIAGRDVTRFILDVRHPKPTFFEPGKTYTRFVGWSIRAQAADVTERFECTVVEKDGGGRPVAFGRLTVACTPTTRGVDLWYLFHDYEWKNDGWKPVGADL